MTDHELDEFMDRVADEVRPIWIQERNKHLIALDLSWARNKFGEGVSDLALLAFMHKARYNIPSIPEALRHESGAWLREFELTDFDGAPLLPRGQLPEGPDR